MKISRSFIFFSVLFGITTYICYTYSWFSPINNHPQFKDKHKVYYIPISIPKINNDGIPYLPIKIENQTILAQLSLGFQGYFALSSSILDAIQYKKYLHLMTYYKMFDTENQSKVYEIPRIEVGPFSLIRTNAYELSEDFFESQISFLKEISPQIDRNFSIIGWHAFLKTNLFLDVANSLTGLADSIETLQQNGYKEKDFVKVPLLMDRGFLEIEVEGPEGFLRCILATGASHNIMHKYKEGQTLEQSIYDNSPSDISLTIGGENFGPTLFFHFPIQTSQLRNDAILGMEFLKKHILFLDFAEGYAYLAKGTCVTENIQK